MIPCVGVGMGVVTVDEEGRKEPGGTKEKRGANSDPSPDRASGPIAAAVVVI